MRSLLILLSLLLAACAAQRQVGPLPMLMHHGPVVQVEEVDVLAMTPEMHAFLDRFVMPYEHADTRLTLLTTVLTDPAVLGFHYHDDRTLTAADAFETRSGNCIGFANLLIAMAREAGLDAHYQEVFIRPQWSNAEDTLLVAKHINVIVRGADKAYVVDTSGLTYRADDPRKQLNDHEALALYYNNLGAEALIASDLSRAHAYLVRAIQTAPDTPDPWINLGVVYSRNRQLEEAAFAYQRALAIDRTEYAALSNLYEVYLATGDEASAARLESRVDRYRRRNPYHLLVLSDEATEEGHFGDSIELLERAIALKNDEHLFYFAKARTLFLLGSYEAAEASLDRARELAPLDRLAEYDRPMAEILLEE